MRRRNNIDNARLHAMIPRDLYVELRKIANHNHVSMRDIIVEALSMYIKLNESKINITTLMTMISNLNRISQSSLINVNVSGGNVNITNEINEVKNAINQLTNIISNNTVNITYIRLPTTSRNKLIRNINAVTGVLQHVVGNAVFDRRNLDSALFGLSKFFEKKVKEVEEIMKELEKQYKMDFDSIITRAPASERPLLEMLEQLYNVLNDILTYITMPPQLRSTAHRDRLFNKISSYIKQSSDGVIK